MSQAGAAERPVWKIDAPLGGWPPPWPQLVEIAHTIPYSQWTLIGGLMVQLHAARAGLALTRPTYDVDMVLHIQTRATTFSSVRDDLEGLGYALLEPMGDGPVHRFARGRTSTEAIDVMVPDRLPEGKRPKALRRFVFAVPGGTSALMKTVICEVDSGVGVVTLSVPDVLGALVLKGAAYTADSRDRARHLDDAAVLACAVTDPVADRERRIGSDRKRLRALWNHLQDANHRSWIATGTAARRGCAALQVLAGD